MSLIDYIVDRVVLYGTLSRTVPLAAGGMYSESVDADSCMVMLDSPLPKETIRRINRMISSSQSLTVRYYQSSLREPDPLRIQEVQFDILARGPRDAEDE